MEVIRIMTPSGIPRGKGHGLVQFIIKLPARIVSLGNALLRLRDSLVERCQFPALPLETLAHRDGLFAEPAQIGVELIDGLLVGVERRPRPLHLGERTLRVVQQLPQHQPTGFTVNRSRTVGKRPVERSIRAPFGHVGILLLAPA